MSEVANAELIAMMKAMMARLDSIEARLDACTPTPAPDTSLVRAVDGAVAAAAANGVDVDARARAAVGMFEVLTRPDMVAIVDLVGKNSEVFTALLRALAQSPGTLDLITQTIASFLNQRDQYGRTLEERIGELMTLGERLTSPRVIGTVKQALDVLEESPDLYSVVVDYMQQMVKQIVDLEGDLPTRLECGVKLLEAATRPEITGIATEGLALLNRSPATFRKLVAAGSAAIRMLESSDIDVEGLAVEGLELLELAVTPENMVLARRALALAQKDPETIGRLLGIAEGMLDRVAGSELDLETLSGQAFELLELAATPENIALARDGLLLVGKLDGAKGTMLGLADELVTKVVDPAFGFEQRARVGLQLIEKLSEPATLMAVQQLTASGMMDPAVLQLLGRVGSALQASATGDIQPRGMFGALGALQSKRVQLAMGFGLGFAEQLGEALEAPLAITGE